MVTKNLIESGAVLSESEGDDGTWRVRLINEGKGSSGYYSAELLESYKHAFDNSISFLNHPSAGPEARNFTEIAGRVIGETWTERAEDGTLGVYANWMPDPDHKRKLETYKDRLGLSIYISGSGESAEDGTFRVTEFDAEDPFRSVDVVIAAGRGGRFEITESMKQMYESRRSDSIEPGVTSAQEERKLEMEKDVEERFTALETLLTSLVAKDEAVKAEAVQAEADKTAVAEALASYAAAVKAIDEAELPAKVVESLRAAALEGTDVAPLIEQAKAIKEATEEAASVRVTEAAPAGRVFGERKAESAIDLGKAFG